MANLKHRWLRILTILLLMLVVVGLVGHFIADVSGREPLPAFGIHAGFVLWPLVAVVSVLMLITALLDDGPIHRWRFLPPLTHPPVALP